MIRSSLVPKRFELEKDVVRAPRAVNGDICFRGSRSMVGWRPEGRGHDRPMVGGMQDRARTR